MIRQYNFDECPICLSDDVSDDKKLFTRCGMPSLFDNLTALTPCQVILFVPTALEDFHARKLLLCLVERVVVMLVSALRVGRNSGFVSW